MANLYNTFDQINASISGVSNYFDFTSTGASLTGANIVLDATNVTIDGSSAVDIKDNGTTVASFQTGSTNINSAVYLGSDLNISSNKYLYIGSHTISTDTVIGNLNIYAGSSSINLDSASVTINGNVIGNVQFNGTNISAPNQTIETDQSLVTRTLSQKDNLFALSQVRSLFPFSTGTGTSGAGTASILTSAENLGFFIASSSTASAWQRIALNRSFIANTSESGASPNATIPIAVAITFFPIMLDSATWEMRFIVGDNTASPPAYGANAISGRGFGAIIYYSSVRSKFELKLFAHNGTTYVTSTDGGVAGYDLGHTAGHYNRLTNLIISSDGAGTIKAFWGMGAENGLPVRASSTPVATLSGGPTSNNYVGQYISVLHVNGNPAPASPNKIKGLNSMLHVGTIY